MLLDLPAPGAEKSSEDVTMRDTVEAAKQKEDTAMDIAPVPVDSDDEAWDMLDLKSAARLGRAQLR